MSQEAVPEGWASARLGELLEPGGLFDGPFGSNLKTSDYTAAGVRVVRLENLTNLRFVEEKRAYISKGKYSTLKKHTVFEGDLLFGSFLDDAVRVTMLPALDVPAIAKADCFCIRPQRAHLVPRYLMFQLAANRTKDALLEEIHGVTRSRVTTRQLRQLEILIAPLAEQERIVAKVEELLARVNAARECLARVPATLKRFRQAVLAAACEGRLTEEWRKTALDSESASALLNRLLKARYSQWGNRHRGYPQPSSPGAPLFDLLPEGWVEATVSQLSWLDVGPAFKSSEFARIGLRLLRGENVAPGRLRWHDTKYWPSDRMGEYERFLVDSGQVILALDRPIVSAGLKIAKVRAEDLPCLLVQRVMRFRVVDAALSDYLFLCLQGRRFEAALTGGMTGSDLPHVTGTAVADFTVPLPSLNEQREIVRRVEALFDLADAIEKRVATATVRAEKLTQAILAKAFRGELVPTEGELARREGRDYEPARATSRPNPTAGRQPF